MHILQKKLKSEQAVMQINSEKPILMFDWL
jgi:hypothetical protein